MSFLALLAVLLSVLAFSLSLMLFVRLKYPMGIFLLFPKVMAAALAPGLALIGIVVAIIGMLSGSPFVMGMAFILGSIAALITIRYTIRAIAAHQGFEAAFGPRWRDQIRPELRQGLPQQRWLLRAPDSPAGRWEQDVPFWTIPETGRKLLCDVWHPLDGVSPSGVGIIHLHGGAWCVGDKDAGSRPFFRHLTAQGHFVMDVAYRLVPETDIAGMVGDVKRAIVWMKTHAAEYNVNSERLILMGESAGGHIAELAAYAPHHPALTPDDVRDTDLTVHGLIALYAVSDLRATYYHVGWEETMRSLGKFIELSKKPLFKRLMSLGQSDEGRMNVERGLEAGPRILPGAPEAYPDWYALLSPVEHVRPGCPPTLLIQGDGDFITPPSAAYALYEKLCAAGVPVINVIFPQTDHAFDAAFPQLSPSAQAARYDLDHFLALLAS